MVRKAASDVNEMSPEAYPTYLAAILPTAEDRALLREIFKDNDWIEPKKAEEN